jgi:hypothetical protein
VPPLEEDDDEELELLLDELVLLELLLDELVLFELLDELELLEEDEVVLPLQTTPPGLYCPWLSHVC